MGNVEQDFSVVYSSGGSCFSPFVVFAFGDRDLVSQELCKVMPVCNQCFFFGHFQMKFFTDETSYPHVPQEAVRLCCAAPSEVQAVLVKVWATVSVVEYPQEQLTVRLCWDEPVEVQLP